MGLEIRNAEQPIDSQKKKAIFVGGEKVGEIDPHLYADRLSWHAVIRLDNLGSLGPSLLQGHGNSPKAAVVNAIIVGRKDRDLFAKTLAQMEADLGTSGRSNEELERLGII
jgi:hypothetical protein